MEKPGSDVRRAESRNPLVSVVIPAYNCEAYVREAVDSVLAQTFTDYELIVVNDASTDSTPQILEEYERVGSLRVVTHRSNRGLPGARNSGIRSARGSYVTFLDSDDLWRQEKLEYQMSIISDVPGLMLLGNGEMRFVDGEAVTFPPLLRRPDPRPLKWTDLLLGGCGLSPSNVIVRAECFEGAGMFDEALRASEDRDLWIRIVRRYGGMMDSGTLSAWRRHRGQMSADHRRMKRNLKRVLQKAFRETPCPLALRGRAYAHLYLDIAVICYEACQRFRAFEHLLKSWFVWPLPLGRKVKRVPFIRLVWAVKIMLGKPGFERLWGEVKSRLSAPARRGRAKASVGSKVGESLENTG